MRLHSLSMTAFGPYAETQTIDFEELNDAGVFLLTGPTGAGKTSILDAVCFALYGVVPGVRDVKTLRSHHAADGVGPEVVLEATLGGRRYRIRRSPEWHRPKKRGDGTIRENAAATLLLLDDDGTERLVSSRVGEVGHELRLALGMSSEQFMQVAMLPQGDFQRFLNATSDERQGVLEKLFHTQRFTKIETWLKDRTRELGDHAAQAEKRVAQLLATIANRADTALPDELSRERLGQVGPAARGWALESLHRARSEHADAVLAEQAAQETLDRLRAEEQLAVQRSEALTRRREAQRELDELAGSEQDAAHDRSVLARHEAAVLVRPLLQPLRELERTAGATAAAHDLALQSLAELPPELRPEAADRDSCSSVVRTLRDQVASLRAVLPREELVRRTGVELQSAMGARDDLRAEHESLAARARTLPAERDDVRRLLTEHQVVAARLADARDAWTAAKSQHDAALRLPVARSAHLSLSEEHLQAREEAATAREHHLDIVERRLAGMAAELAGQLVDDQPCQVCGGTDHPAPAEPSPDAVTEDQQQAAASEVERTRGAVDQLAARLSASTTQLQALETAADGRGPAEAATRLEECRTAVASAEAASGMLDELGRRAGELDLEHEQLSARHQELQAELAARDAEIAALKATFEGAARDVAAAVGPGGASVADTLQRLEQALSVTEAAARALETQAEHQARVEQALHHADTEARTHGFASSAEAAEALLDAGTVESLRRRLQERGDRRARATTVLAEVVLDTESDAPTDLDAIRARLSAATVDWKRASGALGSLTERSASLTSLVDQLEAAVAEWEPLHADHATAEGMAKLVRGMGGDNQLQMRLSSYVLATRLDQVLQAANERLSHMRDQRYTLRRCGRTRGGARAGLGLEVLDTWTGEARAPSTLSGGETFVVSLALALGLADVVTEESGGLHVDTLFIDEGFGMLDPETLDDVMDRIDALRAGGRTVGVVSHVTELRARIPTQVHVDRGKSGSSVAVRTLVP